MLAVLAIGRWGGTATALTQRRERRVVAQVRKRGSPGFMVAQVSAFFYTHMPPSSRGAGGGSGCQNCIDMHSQIMCIMLNYYANPLLSMTYRQSELLGSHAVSANHNI